MSLAKRTVSGLQLCLALICCGLAATAQEIVVADHAVPSLVRFNGALYGLDGKPLTGIQRLAFLLYKEETGGTPLWTGTQNVQADKNGHYSVMLGVAGLHGLPAEVIMSGEARWLAVQATGQPEQARMLLLSVPYVLNAGDAERLAGKPSSASVPAPAPGAVSPQMAPPAEQANEIVCSSGTACKTGHLAVFAGNGGSAGVFSSIMTQSPGAIKIAGSETATGTISAAGDLDAGGNVGASTVTTSAATGGVFSTMPGTGNGIGAVQGSATAKGAAGFTFGVIGQSASDLGRGVFGLASGATGVGVIGESSGTSGIGVVGKDLSGGGLAFSAKGHAQQDRASGGWAKALVGISAAGTPYHISRCFNSTLTGSAATTPPCGFNFTEAAYAQYHIDFGFEVDDRYWSVVAEPFYTGGDNGAIIADAWSGTVLGSNTILEVDLYTDGGDRQTTNFTVVVY